MSGRAAWLSLLLSIFVLGCARGLALGDRSGTESLATSVALPGSATLLPPVCVLRSWLGVPCPTCGLTRSFISLAHGHWHDAWIYHPVGYLLFALTCLNIPLRLRDLRPAWFAKWGWVFLVSTRRWELVAWGTAFALCMAVGVSRWWILCCS